MIDPSKLPFRPAIPRPSSPSKHHRRSLYLSILSAAAAAVLLYLLVFFRSPYSPRFGIIIDAGSSGTRIHVFSFTGTEGTLPSLDLARTAVMRVTPGLSAYAQEPKRAGESLVELLEFAKEKVGKDQWGNTDVRMMATAGLRLLDEGIREDILDSCRRVLRPSGFHFQDDWAAVIPGSDEGIYAWVAANYALGTLGGDPKKTIGIIELGGASAQLTFVSEEMLPPESFRALKFGKITYKLYSSSFLHFGQNVAHESLHELLQARGTESSPESAREGTFMDPCIPKGYSHNTKPVHPTTDISKSKPEYQPSGYPRGNFSECRSAALMLLQKNKDTCLYQQCQLGSAFIPELHGQFLATENFFFTSKFFGLSGSSSLSDLILAGEHFCEDDWSNLKMQYHNQEDEDLSRYCFSSAYIVALLHDSLGIPLNDRRIEFANQVGGIQVEWALGAFIMQKTIRGMYGSDHSSAAVHGNLMLLLLVVSALLVAAAWLASRWKGAQVKTIYDLEKGRYIVTRADS